MDYRDAPPFFVIVTNNKEIGRGIGGSYPVSQVPGEILDHVQGLISNLRRNDPNIEPEKILKAFVGSEPEMVKKIGQHALMSLIHAVTSTK